MLTTERSEAVSARQLVSKFGLVATAKRLGISHVTLTRLTHGLSVNAGTLALVREHLAQLDSEQKGGAR
jgi:hypothetical protein